MASRGELSVCRGLTGSTRGANQKRTHEIMAYARGHGEAKCHLYCIGARGAILKRGAPSRS